MQVKVYLTNVIKTFRLDQTINRKTQECKYSGVAYGLDPFKDMNGYWILDPIDPEKVIGTVKQSIFKHVLLAIIVQYFLPQLSTCCTFHILQGITLLYRYYCIVQYCQLGARYASGIIAKYTDYKIFLLCYVKALLCIISTLLGILGLL